MENKLELRHLAPYLPYALKILNPYGDIVELISLSKNGSYWDGEITPCGFDKFKPILRPLSDLSRDEFHIEILEKYGDMQISHVGTFFFALDGWTNFSELQEVLNVLYNNHFDVFGLIPKGLAIDINTLN